MLKRVSVVQSSRDKRLTLGIVNRIDRQIDHKASALSDDPYRCTCVAGGSRFFEVRTLTEEAAC